MTDWILTRWTRCGQDRLYAETPDGVRLGYVDMTTRELHPNSAADLRMLALAIASYFDPRREPRDTTTPESTRERSRAELPAHDIA